MHAYSRDAGKRDTTAAGASMSEAVRASAGDGSFGGPSGAAAGSSDHYDRSTTDNGSSSSETSSGNDNRSKKSVSRGLVMPFQRGFFANQYIPGFMTDLEDPVLPLTQKEQLKKYYQKRDAR